MAGEVVGVSLEDGCSLVVPADAPPAAGVGLRGGEPGLEERAPPTEGNDGRVVPSAGGGGMLERRPLCVRVDTSERGAGNPLGVRERSLELPSRAVTAPYVRGSGVERIRGVSARAGGRGGSETARGSSAGLAASAGAGPAMRGTRGGLGMIGTR
nr:MAG: hypothetical protein DIU78_16220 [Pseudomonadota bacterium]